MSFTQLIFWYHFPFLKLINQENHFITNSNWKLNYCGFWIVAGYEYLEQLDNKCPEVPTRVAAKSMWKSYQPCILIFKSKYDDEIVLMVKMARQTNAELRIRRPQPDIKQTPTILWARPGLLLYSYVGKYSPAQRLVKEIVKKTGYFREPVKNVLADFAR